MKYFALLTLIILLAACTLDSTQEKALQGALNEYISIHNDGKVTGFAALTHPSVLKYYTDLGDKAFSEKFELVDTSFTSVYWHDAIIRSTEKDGDKIHVLYRLKEVTLYAEEEIQESIQIVAISEDNGVNWLFLEERDYRNDDIIEEKNRLL